MRAFEDVRGAAVSDRGTSRIGAYRRISLDTCAPPQQCGDAARRSPAVRTRCSVDDSRPAPTATRKGVPVVVRLTSESRTMNPPPNYQFSDERGGRASHDRPRQTSLSPSGTWLGTLRCPYCGFSPLTDPAANRLALPIRGPPIVIYVSLPSRIVFNHAGTRYICLEGTVSRDGWSTWESSGGAASAALATRRQSVSGAAGRTRRLLCGLL